MGVAYGQVWGRKHYNVQPEYHEEPVAAKPQSKHYRAWSEDELGLIRNEDLSIEQISEMTGRTYNAVAQKFQNERISTVGRTGKNGNKPH